MMNHRIIIIGAGVSGLACAHRLLELADSRHQAISITVLEAKNRAGGIVKTERRDDFILEHGPDAFIVEKPEAANLAGRLNIAHHLINTNRQHRRSFIVRRNRLRPVPEGFRLIAPTRLTTFMRSDAFSLATRARMLLDIILPRGAKREDETLASFVRRRFGQRALDEIAQPMIGGIYTADPEKLSLRATMPRFLELEQHDRSLILSLRRAARHHSNANQKQLEAVIAASPAAQSVAHHTASGINAHETSSTSGARYNLFQSFAGGMEVLIDGLLARLATYERQPASRAVTCPVTPDANATLSTSSTVAASHHQRTAFNLHLNTAVRGLRFDAARRTWQIEIDNRMLEADAVCLALPSHHAARLLCEVDKDLAHHLAAIEYASTATINFAYKLADIPHTLDGFGFVVPFVERRTLLACTFAHVKFPHRAPEGYALLRAFAGGALQPEVFKLDDAELITRIQQDFADLLGITRPPVFTTLTRWRDSMAQYHLGHLARLAHIEHRLSPHPTLTLAGNYARGAGLPDCIRAGETAAGKLYAALTCIGDAHQP